MKNRKAKLQPCGFLTNPIYLQIMKPHLTWLLKQRKSVEAIGDMGGINASIILFAAIFLEGFFEDILCSFIWSTYDQRRNTKSQAIYEIERLASLNSYIEAFERMGIPLGNFLSKIDSEDLDIIFYFRNLLAHGQRDSYYVMQDGNHTSKAIEGGHYEKIDKFLVKRRVIKRNIHPQGNNLSVIFSDSVADWVSKRVKELCLAILQHIEWGINIHNDSQNFRLKTIKDEIAEL